MTTYSFRHRYAKGMHSANVPVANFNEAMGHTIKVHLVGAMPGSNSTQRQTLLRRRIFDSYSND
ncbi:phage integrase [Synechococcus sp. MEDNS5]|nr:phage integrase [Synechococcus sp. MEDNS5]